MRSKGIGQGVVVVVVSYPGTPKPLGSVVWASILRSMADRLFVHRKGTGKRLNDASTSTPSDADLRMSYVALGDSRRLINDKSTARRGMLSEKLQRRAVVEPLLDPGEEIEWDVGVICTGGPKAFQPKIVDGYVVLTNSRVIFAPDGLPPATIFPSQVVSTFLFNKHRRTAAIMINLQDGGSWCFMTGKKSAKLMAKLL